MGIIYANTAVKEAWLETPRCLITQTPSVVWTYPNSEQWQKNIATLVRDILFTPFYHVDESVKSRPSRSWGVITGDPDNVHVEVDGCRQLNCYTLLCLYWTRGCARPLTQRLSSSVFCTLSPNPTLKASESTRNWCKVTGCPHLAVWTGVQTPEAS